MELINGKNRTPLLLITGKGFDFNMNKNQGLIEIVKLGPNERLEVGIFQGIFTGCSSGCWFWRC